MTSLAVPRLAVPSLRASLLPEERAAQVDTVVQAVRANRAPGVAEQRSTERLSISELNALDPDSIAERLARSRPDRRPGIVKFLDMVDLPRNLIVGLAADLVDPGIKERARASGNKGAYGLPRVNVSDVLESMGVESGIVRGVAGFIGDVAFDPLTYAGPPGWGLQAGRVAVTKAGRKAAMRSLDDIGRGGVARDPLARELFEAAGQSIPNFNTLDPLARKSALSEKVFGSVTGSRAGKAMRVIGADQRKTGGMLDEMLGRQAMEGLDPIARRQADAVAAFVARHSQGHRGLTIGKGGSSVAHIPGTSLGINVPAFTSAGTRNALNRSLALAGKGKAQAAGALARAASEAEIGLAAMDDAIRIANGDDRLTPRAVALDLIDEANSRAAAALDAAKTERNLDTIADPLSEGVEDIGDLVQLTRVRELAHAQVERIKAIQAMHATVEETVEAKRLKDELNTMIRNELPDSLDPARMEPGFGGGDEFFFQASPVHQRLADITAKFENLIGERQTALLNMNDPEMAERVADTIQKSLATAMEAANLSDGAVGRFLTHEDKLFRTMAARTLGVGDEMFGESALQSIANVAGRAYGQGDNELARTLRKTDAVLRANFGRRSGELNAFRAAMTRRARFTAAREGELAIRDMVTELDDILERGGLKNVQREEAFAVLTAMALKGVDSNERYVWWSGTDGGASETSKLLESARKSGLLANPTVELELQRMADKYGAAFRAMGDTAMQDKILRDIRGGYVPVSLSEEGRRVAGAARGTGPEGSLQGGLKEAPYEKPLGTMQYRYKDADGAMRWFFQFEKDFYGAMSAKQLEDIRKINPKAAAEIDRIKADIADFDAMVAEKHPDQGEDIVRQMYARSTAPFDLNTPEMRQRFAFLTGDRVKGNLWETNLAALFARRTAAQATRSAYESFLRTVAPQGIPVQDVGAFATPNGQRATIEVLANGQEIPMPNGMVATVLRDSQRFPVNGIGLKVGSTTYRNLRPDLFADAVVQPFAGMDGADRIFQRMFPEEVAEQIERFAKTFSPENATVLGDALETMIGSWKSVTLLHPSWMVTNMIGSMILASMSGANLTKVARYFPKMLRLRMAANRPELLKGMKVSARGVDMDPGELLHRLVNDGPFQAGRVSGAVMELEARGIATLDDSASKNAANYFKGRGRMISRDYLVAAEQLAGKAGKSKPGAVEKARAGVGAGLRAGVVRSILGPWFRINSMMEDAVRGAVYMAFLDDGADGVKAADQTMKGMFDFTDFTPKEEWLRRRLVPFYSWVRNNAPYQVQRAFSRPRGVAALPKLHNALEEAFAGEEAIPENQRPRWMREQLMVQIGKDPNSRMGLSLLSLLPQQEAAQLGGIAAGGSGSDFTRFATGMFGPSLKIPWEIGAGKELFTGRTISWDKYGGDLSVPEYLLGQIRPFREFGVGSSRHGPIQKAAQEGVGALAGRAILGGRVQPMDDERVAMQLAREFRTKEDGIRRALAIARREGNEEGSLRTRADLMGLYREMIEVGLGDEVPKWAREQLQQFTP